MVCMLKSDNFEFHSDDGSSNKKLPLWKRDSPHEFELALFANSQSARFRSFELRQNWLPKWILHFELKYASCKNESYLLAVIEVSVIRRKVNFFLYNAIRRLRVVRQTQNFRKSNEAQQRLIVGNFHEDWFNATPWNFRTNLAQQPGRNPGFNIRCFDVLLIFGNSCGPSIPQWLVHFSVNMVKLYSRRFREFEFFAHIAIKT